MRHTLRMAKARADLKRHGLRAGKWPYPRTVKIREYFYDLAYRDRGAAARAMQNTGARMWTDDPNGRIVVEYLGLGL